MKSFKQAFDLQKRKEIYERESKNHPTKVGVIIEQHPLSKMLIGRYFKFMANSSYTIHSIVELIRKELQRTNQHFKNNPAISIFLFCGKKSLRTSDKLIDLVNSRDKQDNFLYFMLAETETF